LDGLQIGIKSHGIISEKVAGKEKKGASESVIKSRRSKEVGDSITRDQPEEISKSS